MKNNIVFSDVSDEDEVEGPVGRIKGVEESDSDDADNMFRLDSFIAPGARAYLKKGGGSKFLKLTKSIGPIHPIVIINSD